jgi:excisionase family DNA binding protein
MDTPTPLLTLTEAAAYLKLSPRTLRRYVKDGKATARRLPGGDLRFRVEDLDALLTD